MMDNDWPKASFVTCWRQWGTGGPARGHVAAFFGGRENRFFDVGALVRVEIGDGCVVFAFGLKVWLSWLTFPAWGGKALDLDLFVFSGVLALRRFREADPRTFAAVLRRSGFGRQRGSFFYSYGCFGIVEGAGKNY